MSKHSAKQNYEQLMEWLETVKRQKPKPQQNLNGESRLEYYNRKGNK